MAHSAFLCDAFFLFAPLVEAPNEAIVFISCLFRGIHKYRSSADSATVYVRSCACGHLGTYDIDNRESLHRSDFSSLEFAIGPNQFKFVPSARHFAAVAPYISIVPVFGFEAMRSPLPEMRAARAAKWRSSR